MERIFRFLRNSEHKILLEQAETRKYNTDEPLIVEGRQPEGIFVIRKGTVRIQREQPAGPLKLSRHGAGQIFGEMSFVENQPAGASVVADEPVEAMVVSQDFIAGQIRKNPGFFGRFYQSLAAILSTRLRETNALVKSLSTRVRED